MAKLVARLLGFLRLGLLGTAFLVAFPQAADAVTPGYGTGGAFCSQVTSAGFDLGASFDNVYACGPTGINAFSDPPFENANFGFQCVELANRFLWDQYGINPVGGASLVGGNFVSTVHAANPTILVGDSSGTALPNPGDIISMWGGSSGQAQDGTKSHVAVVTDVSGSSSTGWTIAVMEENGSANGVNSISVSTTGSWSYGEKGYFTTFDWLKLGTSSGSGTGGLGRMGSKRPLDDFVIWRLNPSDSTGYWYVKENVAGSAGNYLVNSFAFGSPGDIPLVCDFNGDGIDDFVIYRLVSGVGTWYVKDGKSPHQPLAIWGAQLGQPGDIPVVGDFTGDHICDFGVFRLVNGTGTWYVNSGSNGQHTPIWGAQHGSPGDVPVVGDMNGDGIADFGIYRVIGGTGYWYFKSGANGQPVPSAWGVQHGGWSGDVPIVGDFNGDGYDDFGIYRPMNGTGSWYVRSGVNVSSMIVNGTQQGGWTGDVPLAGSFG